jgi:hypothetical protein
LIVAATILHLTLPPLSILAMGRLAPRRGIVWTVVAGLALYESALLCFGLLLGYLGLLSAPWPLILWTLVAAILLALAVKGVGPAWTAARAALRGIRPRPLDAFLGLAALTTAYLIGLQVARDWTDGTVNFDSLSYHIPRALLWAWHGNFRPWPACVWHQVGLPVGGDVLLVPGVFLGIGWLGGSWTTAWLSLGAAAAVFAATRGLGAGRRASLVAALAFLSFPAVGPRFADVNSDIAAAFPLLAAWVLVSRAGSVAEAALLFSALCGVGVASKGNVAPAALVLAIVLFWNRLRALLLNGRALTAAAAGTLLAALFCYGSYLPVHRLFGDLVGGNEGRILISYLRGPAGVERAALFGTLHWLIEPFAVISEPPRFDLLDRLGIGRAYAALGAGTREKWYPWIDATTNLSGVFPFFALPWLLAALPRRRRLRGGLLFLALLVALFAPINPNCYASRFAVVLLAAFAVLWGMRAARSPGLVVILLLISLAVDADLLRWRGLPDFSSARVHDRNARIAAAVGSHTLWLLSGSLSNDAVIAGRRADVRFEYLTGPPDGDWVRRFAEIRRTSPWLLLNVNGPKLCIGSTHSSGVGPRYADMPVPELRRALFAAGWHVAFEENGYEVWSAEGRTTGEKRVS